MVSISGVFNPLAQHRPRHRGPSPGPSQQTLRTRSDLLRSCQSWQTQLPDPRWVQPTIEKYTSVELKNTLEGAGHCYRDIVL